MSGNSFCECSEYGSWELGITKDSKGSLRCGNCKGLIDPSTQIPAATPREQASSENRLIGTGLVSKEKKNSPATLDDLLAAENRTTHAVRSLAITFVAAPLVSLFVILGIFLAGRSNNIAAILFVCLSGLAALLGTLYISLDALRKSKVH